MSAQESQFVKWLLGILSSLVVVFIIGIFNFWNIITEFKAETQSQIKMNIQMNQNLSERHDRDVQHLNEAVKEIKMYQRDLVNGQKELMDFIKNKR